MTDRRGDINAVGDARREEPPTRGALAIEARDLSFRYPGAREDVLHNLCWRVPQGAFALLVGGTGSGKSTLLSLLKPEISPAGERSGELAVLGADPRRLAPRTSAGAIGYVFQNPDNQLVCESVWHEMAFGLENLGIPQGEMRRLVAETSYFFGMEEWFRRDVDTLSGGRKQLLALASTLVMQPRLLLLDEPTAQLDPVAEKNFLHALFRVNRELGCTVVVATHQPRAMLDYATCVFGLVDGGVRELSADEVEGLRWRRALLADDGADEAAVGATLGESLAAAGTGAPTHEDAPAVGATDAAGAARPSSALSLTRAWFRYGREGSWVLRNLDLDVARGSIHALVGGNGCGKSTLLGVVAGVNRLQKGRLRGDLSSRALLPQDPRALFAAESVEAELMEWSRACGYGQREADEMRARMGLRATAALNPYDLSGGQQQLLALGKLLLTRPDLLLLDEPTKGLDLPSRRSVARILRGLAAEGTTVLMATHDLDFVSQVADEVSMVFDGEVACTSGREEFFHGNVYYRP